MRRSTSLFTATLALATAACGSGELLPAAPVNAYPVIGQSAPFQPAPVYQSPVVRPAPTVAQVYAPEPTPAIYQDATAPSYTPISTIAPARLPASRPVIEPAEPIRTAYAAPVERAYSPMPVAASRPVPAPRAVSARPPARTEMERLNPGMPRLVEQAPSSETIIARPRVKPARASSVRPRTSSGGLSIANSPTPAGYTSSMTTPPSIEYNIPHIPQEEPLWCWAAAAQQAIGWVNNGRAPAQCAIVALAHGIDVNKCCNDREGVCARTGEIPAIAQLVRRFGGQAAETATVPRDPQEVYRILQTGATLLIRIRPAPNDAAVGIRHMIVVRGIEWLRLPNGRLEATLFYNDPLGSGYRAVSFSEIEGFFEQALIVKPSS